MSDSTVPSTYTKKQPSNVNVDSVYNGKISLLESESAEFLSRECLLNKKIVESEKELKRLKAEKIENNHRMAVFQEPLIQAYLKMGYIMIVCRKYTYSYEVQFWGWNEDVVYGRVNSRVRSDPWLRGQLYGDLYLLQSTSLEVPLVLVRHNLINIGDYFVFNGQLMSVEDSDDGELYLKDRRQHNKPT